MLVISRDSPLTFLMSVRTKILKLDMNSEQVGLKTLKKKYTLRVTCKCQSMPRTSFHNVETKQGKIKRIPKLKYIDETIQQNGRGTKLTKLAQHINSSKIFI